MSATKSYIVLNNKKIFKACMTGVLVAAAENQVMNNYDLKSCALSGGAAAAGVFGSSIVIEQVMTMMPTYKFAGEATSGIEQRIIEGLCGSASSYAINYFLLNNEYSAQQMLPKMAIIAVSTVLAETAADVFMSEDINPFSAV